MTQRLLAIVNEGWEGGSPRRSAGAGATTSSCGWSCRKASEERLEVSLEELRRRGIPASGMVGDADPVLAALEALREAPADEVVIFEHAPDQARWFDNGLFEQAQMALSPCCGWSSYTPGIAAARTSSPPSVLAAEHATLFLVEGFQGVSSGPRHCDGVLGVLLAWAIALLAIALTRARQAARRFERPLELPRSPTARVPAETFDAICDVLVPEFADFCMIDVIGEEGVERAAVRVGPGGGEETERVWPSASPRSRADGRAGSRSLEPRFFERMREAELRELAHDDDDLDFLRGLGSARRSPSR